jgi:hypothetical protein
METKFIRALVSLGVPGVALGIFYLLLRRFNFRLSEISPTLTAMIAVLFLLIVGGITFYALYRWAPERPQNKNITNKTTSEPKSEIKKIIHEFKIEEEVVTQEELLKTISHDVLKIKAHSHEVGVASEYKYINKFYPSCTLIRQSLTTLDLLKKSKKYDIDQVHFDVIKISLIDGREKEILFDISSFFDGQGSSFGNKDEFIAGKLNELYT